MFLHFIHFFHYKIAFYLKISKVGDFEYLYSIAYFVFDRSFGNPMNAPILQVGFDPGSSLTKVVYRFRTPAPKILVMEPHVLSFLSHLVQDAPLAFGTVDPIHQAWIKLKSDDESCYLVGELAKQKWNWNRLDRLKYEQALYKLLAVVGAIAQRENLQRFGLEVVALLPYGEYENREQFKKQVQAALRQFYFRGQRLNVTLKLFICSPEGGGLAWSLMAQKGEAWFKSKVFSVLMFGHRNTSCLVFRKGQLVPEASSTSDLGFVRLLQGVVQRSAGQSLDALVTPVFAMGAKPTPDHLLMRQLLRSTVPANQTLEAKQLSEAISSARAEYWEALVQWLELVVPKSLNELIISGGAAQYFKAELNQQLSWANPVWSTLASQPVSEELLNCRMTDIWHLFLCGLPHTQVASEVPS
jgi:hypothetical protein